MKIFVKAKPKSKKEFVKKIDATNYIVAVNEIAEKGKANQAIIKSLAEFFDIPQSEVVLVSGATSRQKIFEIPLSEKQLEKETNQTKQISLFE